MITDLTGRPVAPLNRAMSGTAESLDLSCGFAPVVGSKPLPRTEVIKGLWKYIKKHNLQDRKNRRAINADATLMPLFKKGQVTMFELAKIANKNLS